MAGTVDSGKIQKISAVFLIFGLRLLPGRKYDSAARDYFIDIAFYKAGQILAVYG